MPNLNLVAVALSTLLLSPLAQAAVVFENGTNGDFWSGNNPFTYQQVLNSFSLSSDATINSLTYNAFTTASTLPVTQAQVSFYDASHTLLFSQALGISSSTLTGSMSGYSLIDYSINLPSLNLTAGNYYLGLQVSPTQWDMHWSIPNSPSLGGEYGSDGWAHYFRLENTGGAPISVPEPSAALLMLLGLAGLAWRRKAKV